MICEKRYNSDLGSSFCNFCPLFILVAKFSGVCGGLSALVYAAVREVDSLELEEEKDTSPIGLAIQQSRRQLSLYREETGIPGISIAVELDGNLVWSDGIGYADVENHTPCTGNTVMRIASISKPITMALVGRLWQEGVLDIDKPIHHYVPEFTPKTVNGKTVSPSLRQLASHLGGIRHYRPVDEQRKVDSDPTSVHAASHDDSVLREFYSRRRYNGVRETLALFKDDEFVYPPGERFLYTTYGFTLLGAAAEAAGSRPLPVLYRQLFRHLSMNHTHLDDYLMVIPNRSRQYIRTKDGRLENAPYVDNSNKWAGGGLISSAKDISHFGSIMLKSYQCAEPWAVDCDSAYLSSSTMRQIWTAVDKTHCWHQSGRYALGWCVLEPPKKNSPSPAHPLLDDNRPIFTHSGGAVGGTSMLLVLPAKQSSFLKMAPFVEKADEKKRILPTVKAETLTTSSDQSVKRAPRGVSVAILANLQGIHGIGDLALDIALRFDRSRPVN